MNKKELEHKYGKKIINKIFRGNYLDGCTIAIVNGEEDIPESDIICALKEMRGEEIYFWD